MKRILSLFFVLAFASMIYTTNAQYTGEPFFPDTCYVFPGDHVYPVFFDLGDSAVVFTAETPGAEGSGGTDQRTGKQQSYFGTTYDDYGQYFLNNTGAKSYMRTTPDTFNLMYTVYFAETGYYKAKIWADNKPATMFILNYPDLTTVDTLTLSNGTATGEYEAKNPFEWRLFEDDSVNITSAGKYVLQFSGSDDAFGAFALFTNTQYASGDDTATAKLTTVVADTTWIYEGDSLQFNSDKNGELIVMQGDRNHSFSYNGHKGVVYPKALLYKAKAQDVIAGDFWVDFDGLLGGTYSLTMRTANGVNSPRLKINVVDTTNPTLTMTSGAAITAPATIDVTLNEAGTVYLVPSGTPDSVKFDTVAVAKVYLDEAGDSSIVTAGLVGEMLQVVPAGKYILYGQDKGGNKSDSSATITITASPDVAAPTLTMVDTMFASKDDSITASINEAGVIYVIPGDTTVSLENLEKYKVVKFVVDADEQVKIAAADLDTTKKYDVYGADLAGNISNLVTIDPPVSVSLQNPSMVQFSVYPNPSSVGFNVDLRSISTSADVNVYNVSGQLIYSELAKTGTIHHISNQYFTQKGIYFIRVETEVQKIVVK